MSFTETQTISCSYSVNDADSVAFAWLRNGQEIVTIGTQPVAPSVTEPTAVSLTVTATGGAATITYQWESSPDGEVWSTVAGADRATYTIPSTSNAAHDGLWLRCVATDGTLSDTSDAVQLTVAAQGGGGPTYDTTLTGAQAAGFTVPAGEVWKISGAVTVNNGSVIVLGRLVMRAGDSLTFLNVNEAAYEGDTENPTAHYKPVTDIGLWVREDGVLDVQGTPKTGWLRTTGALTAGASSLTLESAPTGWLVGDELAITPTLPVSDGDYNTAYDMVTITSVSGATIGFSPALTYAHPVVNGLWKPEVLNLTRDVRIEGTPTGRAHINFNHVLNPQYVSHLQLRYLGPRQVSGSYTEGVKGRYGIHFHLSEDAVRGSLMQGIVARDMGFHSFVTHLSHQVTWRDCIAHEVFDEPYWWDPRESFQEEGPPTNDVFYDRCVASKVKFDPAFRGSRLGGFNLVEGSGNRCIDCVAVGIQGSKDASGFHWAEGASSVWIFQDCVTHNNKRHGIFVWQNTPHQHIVEDFVIYNCGEYGISHGAYVNGYVYRNGQIFGCGVAPIGLHAGSRSTPIMVWENLTLDANGKQYCIESLKHNLEPGAPVQVTGCTFSNYTGTNSAAIGFIVANPGDPVNDGAEYYTITGCTFSGNELYSNGNILDRSLVTITTGGITYRARRADQATGTLHAPWNMKREVV